MKLNHAWFLAPLFLLAVNLAVAQADSEVSQETMNKRVAEIVQKDLQEGVIILPGGVRATQMRVHVSDEEMKEIKTFARER